MKKIKLLVASLLLATAFVNAQTETSETFNYQAVARDASGLTMNNQDISIQISVLDSGIVIYTETHAVTTSKFGLLTLSIGNGIPSLGDFSTIDWSKGNYNVEVAMDEKGGTNYTVMGASTLKAVPYAMHAKTAENVFSGDYNDLKNKPAGGNKAAGDPWLWGGNAGTTNGVDFIGTTDAQDLDIRTNNVNRLRVTQKGQLEVLNTGKSVFIGQGAGENDDLTNNFNVFVGFYAGNSTSTGNRNVAVGYKSLKSNSIGYNNTATGYYSLNKNTHGNHNTANGHFSLYSNTYGTHNTATGNRTLYRNQTGEFNVANGSYALYNNLQGRNNVAVGVESLYSNTSGGNNVANGSSALFFNTNGNDNVANGFSALNENTEGSRNVANGSKSLENNSLGTNNTANGYNSLSGNNTGSYNVANGSSALFWNISGSYNTAIGANAYHNGNESNSTALGYGTAITASNQVRIGNNAVTSIGGFQNWSNVSDARFKTNVKENVAGLNFIMSLRPVTYNLDLNKIDNFLGTPDSISKVDESMIKARQEKENMLQTGFIAQEVEAAAKKAGYNFSGVDVPKNDKDHYGIRYAEFVVPLVKAVQEQQQIIASQEELIKKLMERLDTIEKQVKN